MHSRWIIQDKEKEMDTKKEQTMKRLLKKLSALRATLSDDEQELLDQLIMTPGADVEAHRLDPRYDPRLDPRLDPKAQPGADVEAHRLDPRAFPRVVFKIEFDLKKQVYKLIP
jgi:hypothetical protein